MVKRWEVMVTAAAILAVLLGCASHERKLQKADVQQLDQSELEALFAVKRVAEIKAVNGTAGRVTYYPDKRQEISLAGKEDTGEYRIDGDRFCSKWTTVRKGEKCTKFYRISDNFYQAVDGNGDLYFTLSFLE